MQNANEPAPDDRLKWAIDFVTSRIHEQSEILSEPLDVEEEEKLAHLPDSYTVAEFDIETGAAPLIPPDHTYDKLVRLAKSAVASDRLNFPNRILHWELADVILRLNEHRLAWLIERAGIDFEIKKPWWDGWLLLLSGIVLCVITVGSGLLLESRGVSDERVLIAVVISVFGGMCVMLYSVLNRFEKFLWRNRMRELTDRLQNS